MGSVAVLGLLSSLLGDFATLFGCTVKLDDSVTAVALVAFGTTVPGIFFFFLKKRTHCIEYSRARY